MNFQRINSISNAHVGRDFEDIALAYFHQNGLALMKNVGIFVGLHIKKQRNFDLGSVPDSNEKVVVECKSHKWTSGGNVPSAKITVWNESMYYFYLLPVEYRKIFFILRDFCERRNETLGEYYIRTHGHLIPRDVEILEYDEETREVRVIKARE
ncbi:hypothetical protein [Sporosarcina sp. Marseille-Q4943]|uniref:hypothetical protein n=1 Tax=Sporosarcina sp. Marseille-Q4943 TaxID=2942204 RepID=UPI00208DA729|nr:hypothetical protein [Sporosarcina sp. Marseille-Q4943]